MLWQSKNWNFLAGLSVALVLCPNVPATGNEIKGRFNVGGGRLIGRSYDNNFKTKFASGPLIFSENVTVFSPSPCVKFAISGGNSAQDRQRDVQTTSINDGLWPNKCCLQDLRVIATHEVGEVKLIGHSSGKMEKVLIRLHV
jgi:hypothetical protein